VAKTKRTAWTAAEHDRAAEDYLRRLPLEHFMEALPQSSQRRITLESLDLLRARRPEVQVFNEMLIEYFFKGRLRRVVSDNLVRLSLEVGLLDGWVRFWHRGELLPLPADLEKDLLREKAQDCITARGAAVPPR
jgi:hypothetical protein